MQRERGSISRGVFTEGASVHAPSHFWSEKYQNSQQKRVFDDCFVILLVMAQAVANPKLTLLKLIKIMNIFR